MIFPPSPFFGLIAVLTAWVAATAGPSAGQPQMVRRMIVRDEVLIHVPIGRRPLPILDWTERKGPKCLPSAALAGAAMAGPSAIDFLLRDRRRFRARLDSDCEGLDFYGGFYVEPEDNEICARRDEIRSRMGGSCRIDRFRRLVPKVKH